MSDVTGPISTLPGTRHRVPAGQKCDTHDDRFATARIQGETDSMGSELIDMCEECLANHEEARHNHHNEGACAMCNSFVNDRVKWRDPDEGMCGPVYDVCRPCVQKSADALAEELDDVRLSDIDDSNWDSDPFPDLDIDLDPTND